MDPVVFDQYLILRLLSPVVSSMLSKSFRKLSFRRYLQEIFSVLSNQFIGEKNLEYLLNNIDTQAIPYNLYTHSRDNNEIEALILTTDVFTTTFGCTNTYIRIEFTERCSDNDHVDYNSVRIKDNEFAMRELIDYNHINTLKHCDKYTEDNGRKHSQVDIGYMSTYKMITELLCVLYNEDTKIFKEELKDAILEKLRVDTSETFSAEQRYCWLSFNCHSLGMNVSIDTKVTENSNSNLFVLKSKELYTLLHDELNRIL